MHSLRLLATPRILAGLGAIVFAAALIAGASGAFFSDTESSSGNTFSAGEVDLTIDGLTHLYNGDPGNAPDFTQEGFTFGLSDLKPLDNGSVTYNLTNGSNEAYLCAAVVETGNNDNGVNDPESDAGDTTDGAGNGELGQFLSFRFGSTTGMLDGSWQSLGVIGGNAATSSGIGYCFGTYVGGVCTNSASSTVNIAQTDSLSADVQFYAVQTRNNPNFTCASLPPANGGTTTPPVATTTVGALLGSYTAPTGEQCNVTVDDTGGNPALDTITEGISAASAGQTVCVAAGTYNEDVAVNKDITLAGAGSGTTNIVGQTAGESGAVVITANGATVQGFNITDAAGGIAALRISGARSGILVDSNTLNAVSGGNSLLMDGGQSNHTISNNVINGVAGQPIAYVNGLASVAVASTNVDFTQNTFGGAGSLALGQEAGGSSITLNKFSAVTSFTDVEDWEGGNVYTQNNFNDAGLNLQHSENGNTGDNGITSAENNWWGDTDASDGDVNPNVDVDFDPEAAVAFAEN